MPHQDFRQGRLSGRRPPTKKPKPRIEIFCEGSNTEPQYFRGLASVYGNSLVKLEIHDKQGVPNSVVDAARLKFDALTKNAKKSNDSFDKEFQVWAVFDVDTHPRVADAKQNAKSKGVHLACSNPCFEIWLLFHLEDCHKPYDGRDLQRYLTTKLPSYDPKGSKSISFSELSDGVAIAIERAAHGLAERLKEGHPEGNPSTTVGSLAQVIINHGRARTL